MSWIITPATENPRDTPDYGAVEVKSITATSTEIIPAGTGPRFASLSNTPGGKNIYLSFGVAVDVTAKTYNFIIPPGYQDNKFEIPAQAIHAACATGETASLIIGVAE